MELSTASILVQLVLIFLLVAVFSVRRYLRVRGERRHPRPGNASLLATPAPMDRSAVRAAPTLVDLPPIGHRPGLSPDAQSLVSEELLPPCFADTCADWAQVVPQPDKSTAVPDTRFSLSDWSAPTDRMALDHAPDPAMLDWALDARVEPIRPSRLGRTRSGLSADVLHNRAAGAPLPLT